MKDDSVLRCLGRCVLHGLRSRKMDDFRDNALEEQRQDDDEEGRDLIRYLSTYDATSFVRRLMSFNCRIETRFRSEILKGPLSHVSSRLEGSKWHFQTLNEMFKLNQNLPKPKTETLAVFLKRQNLAEISSTIHELINLQQE